jgi:hypothetical protein
MKVRRGDIVETWGPHSNGHMEQSGYVTHVYGEGDEAGVLVNLLVMVDLGGPLIADEVACYPTRQHAFAALVGAAMSNGGAQVCWPRETT